MEMLQTHCYATGTVTLLWKCYKLIVMQQALLRYYGNATGCIGHATKETQHVTIFICLPIKTVHDIFQIVFYIMELVYVKNREAIILNK
jgi:hypothetical protein